VSSLLGPLTGGVVFRKLSKLLDQENALSAPCLRGDVYSPHVPRGTGMLRDFIDCFSPSCHFGNADDFPVVVADAQVERAGARPGRAVWRNGPDMNI
jgi:hypothetical protein